MLQWQHHDGSAWYNDRGIKASSRQGFGAGGWDRITISPRQVTTSPNDFEAFCRSEDAEAVGVVQIAGIFTCKMQDLQGKLPATPYVGWEWLGRTMISFFCFPLNQSIEDY